MSPKSGTTTSSERISTDKPKPLVTKRNLKKDDPFSWFEKPFGQEQHVINIIVFSIAHTGALYYCYVFLTGQVNRASILFGNYFIFLILPICHFNSFFKPNYFCCRNFFRPFGRFGYNGGMSQVLDSQNVQGQPALANFSYDTAHNNPSGNI